MAKKKASVKLTGGAGFAYEDHVAARLLLDMLAGTNSLGTDFGNIIRIDWQVRDSGWLADDLAVACKNLNGEPHIGLSIKSAEQVKAAGFPKNFVEIAWAQWLGEGTTRKLKGGNNAFGLVTGKLTADVEDAWSTMHGQIIQTTPERMVSRLTTTSTDDGSQTSQVQRNLFSSFHCPVQFKSHDNTDGNETARLLRHIRLLHFDYESHPSRATGQALADCQRILISGDAKEAAELWSRLIGIASEKRPAGGSIDYAGIMSSLRGIFIFRDHPDYRRDWELLDRHSQEAMGDVRTEIPGLASLSRDAEQQNIQTRLNERKSCFLVGESGSGKSALAKTIAQTHYQQKTWMTGSMLDHESASQFEQQLGLTHPLAQILCASSHPCLVVFDGMEGYSPRALRLVANIVQEVSAALSADHIHFLFTAQADTTGGVITQLAIQGISSALLDTVPIRRPSEDEVHNLVKTLPQLRWSSLRAELRPILSNLKILDLVVRAVQSGKTIDSSTFVGLTALIDLLWEHWIEGNAADSLARSHLLMRLAIMEAETWSSSVPRTQLAQTDQSALQSLIGTDLIHRHNERVRFSHDLLGDWARMKVLVAEEPMSSPENRERAAQPRWHRAVRLFGQRLLEQSSDGHNQWQQAVAQMEDKSDAGKIIRDLFLESLFLTNNAVILLERVWPVLAANNGRLLNDMLKRFLYAATLPDSQLIQWVETPEEATRLEYAFRIPFWPYWGPMLSFMHAHHDDIARLAPLSAATVCSLWLQKMPVTVNEKPMPWRHQAAEVAIAIAREIQAQDEEGGYYAYGKEKVIYEAALYAASDLPDEVAALCLELAKRRDLDPVIKARVMETKRIENEGRKKRQAAEPELTRKMKSYASPIMPVGQMRKAWPDGPRKHVANTFQAACLDTAAFVSLIRVRPDIALEVLLAVCIEAPHRENPYSHPGFDECGIEHWSEAAPPLYFRGPFLLFLREAPEQGIACVLKLINFATHRFIEGSQSYAKYHGQPEIKNVGLDISVNGVSRQWLGNANVFRWHNGWPHSSKIVPSVLMALEKWLYEQIDQEKDIIPWVERIIAESESLAFGGLLLDIGKKKPELFIDVLKPLLTVWELYIWDFQITVQRVQMESFGVLGWGLQPQKMIDLALEWYRLPHRALLLQGIAIKWMQTQKNMAPFFDQLRTEWSAWLDQDGEPNNLRLLIERLNPANYHGEEQEFHWPEAIEKENTESLRRSHEQMQLMRFPIQSRKRLDEKIPLSHEQLLPFWEKLQSLDATHPSMPTDESGHELLHIGDILCAGMAVLLTFHSDWLTADPERIKWCRQKLEAILQNPPPWSRFDSEVAIGSNKWDAFSAECGISLLAINRQDQLARKLVAVGVAGFHYETTTLTMLRAFENRDRLGDDFNRMQNLAIQWSLMSNTRPVRWHKADDENASWLNQNNRLMQEFISGNLSTELPDLNSINIAAVKEVERLRIKQFPELADESGRSRKTFKGKREVLHAPPPGIDLRVITHAFAWLNLTAAHSLEEHTRWLKLTREFFALSLASIPVVEDAEHQEIDSLPNDFDQWIYGVIAEAILCMKPVENPDIIWKAILNLGTPVHKWVERFFWGWFTKGLRAAASPEVFVKIWSEMIIYALAHPLWNSETNRTYDLDDIVFELLGFNYGVPNIGKNEKFTTAMGQMIPVFERASQQWFRMPRVVNGFLNFVIQPGAAALLIPAIGWLSQAMSSFSQYDWREQGMEGNLTEFLRVCWERAGQKISGDPDLRKAFTTLLTILGSRGSHAGIALRDQILSSIPG